MKPELSKEWCMKMAALEGDSEIGAGLLAFDEIDNADLSKELGEAQREVRLRLLQIDDKELTDLYYKVVTFSIHEAARRARNEILERCHLSNPAEA